MKTSISAVLICAGLWPITVQAQSQETVIKEKMKVFSGWVGQWQGEASVQMGPGEPEKSKVDEKIESKLEGTLLLIEGIGKATDPATKQETIVHHALGLVSFDPASGQYKLRSHLKDGRNTDAWLIITGENKFQWGFDLPNSGKIRYAIVIDPVKKTWNETGEYSGDGNTWSKFFEMDLKKTE